MKTSPPAPWGDDFLTGVVVVPPDCTIRAVIQGLTVSVSSLPDLPPPR